MKSEWKPYSNVINGEKMYIAGRQLDADSPLHSGNVEFCGQYEKDRDAVLARCEGLNGLSIKKK
jgi:hypothetical protein